MLKAEAKEHLRVASAFTADDDVIDRQITVAREYVENVTRRAVITQIWDIKYDRFPFSSGQWLELPKPPTQSVTSVTYVDTAGDSQTWASGKYQTDLAGATPGPKAPHGRLMPAWGEVWPSTREQLNAVTIRVVAGYDANGTLVPGSMIHAMELLIGHWYENRIQVVIGENPSELPMGVDALLWPYRVIVY